MEVMEGMAEAGMEAMEAMEAMATAEGSELSHRLRPTWPSLFILLLLFQGLACARLALDCIGYLTLHLRCRDPSPLILSEYF